MAITIADNGSPVRDWKSHVTVTAAFAIEVAPRGWGKSAEQFAPSVVMPSDSGKGGAYAQNYAHEQFLGRWRLAKLLI